MPRKSSAAKKKAEKSKATEELRGYIDKVIFPRWGKKSKNGFAILAVTLSGDSRVRNESNGVRNESNESNKPRNNAEDPNRITAKGTMPNPREGDEVMFKGCWVNDKNYGKQFQFTEFEILLPTSRQGVIAYFSSDKFYGLGRAAAEKIVDALGENCLNLLKDNPELAYQVNTLSQKQQQELAEKMGEHNALGDLIALICRHGIGTAMAGKIYNTYGPRAIDIVKENPYQLIKDVNGVGFNIADSIGQAVSIKPDSEFRIEAAIMHVLEESKNEGHVAMKSAEITNRTLKLLDTEKVSARGVANTGLSLVQAGELVRVKDEDKGIDLIYLAGMYEIEKNLSNKLKSMVQDYNKYNGAASEMIEDLVGQLEKSMDADMEEEFELAPEQREAVEKALSNKISVITGGPGTGKSTITKLIVSGYESVNPLDDIYLVAPTGRASKRLAEATGREASTIHRLLKYNPEEGFMYNEWCQLPGPGLLIADEYSMCDIELADNLFKAIPDNMQVVIIGDIDQLPSVGPGAVLRDIIHSEVIPTTRLKYIYRQEEGSTISLLADMIKHYDETKKMPNLKELEEMCGGSDFQFIEAESAEDARDRIEELMTEKKEEGMDIMDFQVLTPIKTRGAAGADKLNVMLRDIFNPGDNSKLEKPYGDKLFRFGDKVMKVNSNDYKKMLFNGDIGLLEIINKDLFFRMDGNGFVVNLDADDLMNIELAYSFTCHKSQGGQCDFVPLVCIWSHYIMLQRNLIYTGITRAKRKLVIVGTQKAFEQAVKNNKVERRYGLLKERLRGEV